MPLAAAEKQSLYQRPRLVCMGGSMTPEPWAGIAKLSNDSKGKVESGNNNLHVHRSDAIPQHYTECQLWAVEENPLYQHPRLVLSMGVSLIQGTWLVKLSHDKKRKVESVNNNIHVHWGLKSNVIGVRYLVGTWCSSDTHAPPSADTLTRLPLHLNQLYHSSPYRFFATSTRSEHGPLCSYKEGLKAKVIDVRDLLGAWGSSDTHLPPSDTLIRFTLHLNQLDHSPYRFGSRFDPDDLSSYKEGLKAKVISVRQLLMTWGSSDTHTPPCDTLTKLTIQILIYPISTKADVSFFSVMSRATARCGLWGQSQNIVILTSRWRRKSFDEPQLMAAFPVAYAPLSVDLTQIHILRFWI